MATAVAPIVWDDRDNFSVANIGILRRDIPSFGAMTDDEIKGLIPGDFGPMIEVNNALCNRAETTARHSIPQLPDFFDDLLDHDLHYTFTWRDELQAYCLDYSLCWTWETFLMDSELNGMIRSIATAWKREGKGLDEEYANRFYTRD
ncbi:hypothetical protein CKM354_000013000 [Cercospora kikuchii]|uniref:Uncharacterized protein n=1 Tax=Cercospora kikuchii TaxID=84275 RepID=A0A9P3F6Y4_9PEZI|nr:uncharacterized protein CKM354_000013000 [Cercospora kikuchii]GIZ36661.1 hypothetical protein CKM354_000013000 [Cercospora kikuchii]